MFMALDGRGDERLCIFSHEAGPTPAHISVKEGHWGAVMLDCWSGRAFKVSSKRTCCESPCAMRCVFAVFSLVQENLLFLETCDEDPKSATPAEWCVAQSRSIQKRHSKMQNRCSSIALHFGTKQRSHEA